MSDDIANVSHEEERKQISMGRVGRSFHHFQPKYEKYFDSAPKSSLIFVWIEIRFLKFRAILLETTSGIVEVTRMMDDSMTIVCQWKSASHQPC